jgi:hypothetical protein
MYFPVVGNPIPVSILTNASTQGQTKTGVDRSTRKAYTLHGLTHQRLFKLASVGAGVASTTVQDYYLCASRIKIPKIMVAVSALNAVDGSITFNIVVGTGSYETGAVAATDGAVWTGTPNHDGTVTVTVAGHAVVYTEVGGDTSPTALMAHVATAINADGTVGPLVTATSSVGHLILTWNEKGTSGNGQTLSVATTDSFGGTFVVDSATFSGGAAGTAIALGANDNSSTSGVCTNPAPAGVALFSQDVAFNATNFPFTLNLATTGITTGSGGVSGSQARNPQDGNTYTIAGLIPTYPDQVFEAGSSLTLRVTTPAVVGSITNMLVSADVEIQPAAGAPTFPTNRFPQAPGNGLGVPFGAIDF